MRAILVVVLAVILAGCAPRPARLPAIEVPARCECVCDENGRSMVGHCSDEPKPWKLGTPVSG